MRCIHLLGKSLKYKVITHIKLFQVLGVFQNYNPSTLVWSAEQIPRQQEEEDLE